MFLRSAPARRAARLALTAAVVAAIAAPAKAGFNLFTVGGSTLGSSIDPTITSFRTAIGGVNNANAGPTVGGRREINWDGGTATTAAVSGSTLSTFTNTRGATFTTVGPSFLQTPLTDTALTSIQASYATTFTTFSVQRVFTPTGSNVTTMTISSPGSNGATPATVSAFGAVFSDVDTANTTKIEFFDLANASLFLFNAPTGSAAQGTLSFAGAVANAGEKIAKIVITTGNQPLGAADLPVDGIDVVVMDDFIYAEPIAVPEPTGAALAGAAAAALALWSARRCQ